MISTDETRPVLSARVNFPRIARLAAMTLLGLALPVFLIVSNTWYITNSEWLYSYNWWRNDIPARTGLPVGELNSGADQIKAYFNNDEERLDLRVTQGGVEVSLYSDREVDHMVDVKGLMQGVRSTMIWTGLISLGLLIGLGAWLRHGAWPVILHTLKRSAIGTAGVVVVLGVIMAINFTWLFTQFHFISFANDLWRLNPRTDYLLMMFPERFFMEATIFIALFVVIQFTLLLGLAAYAHRRFGNRAVGPRSAKESGASS